MADSRDSNANEASARWAYVMAPIRTLPPALCSRLLAPKSLTTFAMKVRICNGALVLGAQPGCPKWMADIEASMMNRTSAATGHPHVVVVVEVVEVRVSVVVVVDVSVVVVFVVVVVVIVVAVVVVIVEVIVVLVLVTQQGRLFWIGSHPPFAKSGQQSSSPAFFCVRQPSWQLHQPLENTSPHDASMSGSLARAKPTLTPGTSQLSPHIGLHLLSSGQALHS